MNNYPTYKLGDVADILDSFRKPINSTERTKRIQGKKENELYPYYGATGQVGLIDEFLTDGEYVLVGEDGAPFLEPFKNKSYIIRGKAWVNNHAHILSGKKDVLSNQYLNYFLNSFDYRDYVNGTTRLKLTQGNLTQIPIPLPPLPTQHQIVSRIESLFAELDKAEAHLRTEQQQLKTYRQAVLNETMKTTKYVNVGDVIEELGQGWSPKCCNEPSLNDTEWGVIKTTAIQPCCFIEGENKKLPKILEPRQKHELKVGDILITRAGPKVRVGVCCLVKKVRPRLINCDKAYRILLKKDIIDAQYFEYVINSPTCVKKIDKLKTGISDSGVNLTQNRFFDLQIPLPPLSEQQRIVKEIETRLSQASTSSAYIENALQQAEALRQSILKKAFSGEFVSAGSTTKMGA